MTYRASQPLATTAKYDRAAREKVSDALYNSSARHKWDVDPFAVPKLHRTAFFEAERALIQHFLDPVEQFDRLIWLGEYFKV